jgi:UDP-N-acetylglucosamine 2-epimerase (non-hydrolysing)
MKIMTILGTRPDLIRLSEIIKKIDKNFKHVVVHTGQNFDRNLRDTFFEVLGLRQPDYQFNLKNKFVGFEFISNMIIDVEKVIKKEKPDKILILGDVNSALSAYVAKQMHIPVFHMEAGNRCYDDNVPEEINRRIVDACSDYLLAYTQRSREQLLKEGYSPNRIIVIGNPITEVLLKNANMNKDSQNKILRQYKVEEKNYILSTVHRTENVTNYENLNKIINALNMISKTDKILLSVHPKLSSMMKKFKIKLSKNILAHNPFDFREFTALIGNAKLVLSDSGTIPEECSILKIPSILMRRSTERPELLENNSMILSGIETDSIVDACKIALNASIGEIPYDYRDTNVSDKIIKILSGKI